jgi:hypothetical protein
VLSRLARITVIIALVCAIGLHWTLLQSVAWVTMIVDYAQTGPLKEALIKTFDGKHPCNLCQIVTEGKKSAKPQELQQQISKLDLCVAQPRPALFPPAVPQLDINPGMLASQYADSPHHPPPRLS